MKFCRQTFNLDLTKEQGIDYAVAKEQIPEFEQRLIWTD
jgi:hypothetical protein